MDFPDDLPEVLEYYLPPIDGVGGEDCWITQNGVPRTSKGHVITQYPRTPITFRGSSGDCNARCIKPTIPYGATHYRVLGGEWHRIAEMPASWLPFTNRQRGTEMDPRMPPCPKCGNETGTYGELCGRCKEKSRSQMRT